MTRPITFSILGTPVGFARTRPNRAGFLFTPTLQRNASAAIRMAAEAEMRAAGAVMFDEPVSMELLAEFMPPASWSKKKRGEALLGIRAPGGKPDLDNLIKLVSDACCAVIYRDDALIVDLHCRKRYSEQPKIVCTICPILRPAELPLAERAA